MVDVQNVWIIVLIVIVYLNVEHVVLVMLLNHKQLVDKLLKVVKKSVVMVLNINNVVMMEILIMVMVVIVNVKNNQDGSAVVAHPINLVPARK
jgi:hypothetical protein